MNTPAGNEGPKPSRFDYLKKIVGQAPGTLVFTGEKKTQEVEIEVFSFSEESLEERRTTSWDESLAVYDPKRVNWINIIGLHDISVIKKVGEQFQLHNLLLEDVLNVEQRSKCEYFGDSIFFTIKMFHQQTEKGIEYEHVSFVLFDNLIISFQEKPKDIFDLLRQRLRESYGTIRSKKADYLFYRFVDTIVDNYYLILDSFSDKIEDLEEEVLEKPTPASLQQLQQIRKQLIYLRKAANPLRESLNNLVKSESKLIRTETTRFLSDVQDHVIYVVESLDTFRDLLGGIMDLYMNALSNKMNEIMKVLTIMSAIFVPLTFIAGIYGMNFESMPELSYRYGYAIVWIAIISVAIGMIMFFKRKGWW